MTDDYAILKNSKLIHPKWYLKTYPDVEMSGMSPIAHYLHYGAAMGRNPGKSFNTRDYCAAYPEVAESGHNPAVHFHLVGQAKGYSGLPRVGAGHAEHLGLRAIALLREKLLSLGFTRAPLADLRDLRDTHASPTVRANAAFELISWQMRQKTADDHREALAQIAALRAHGCSLHLAGQLTVLELIAHYLVGDIAGGRVAYDRAGLAGEVTEDATLASANFVDSPEEKCRIINQVMGYFGLPELALLPDETLSAYDRLTSAVALPPVHEGPLVSVLIAAYNSADMIGTTLRSLQEQTWKPLEIIVLDDCSSDDTVAVARAMAESDPRIRVVQMEQNGGAYVARNHGLRLAQGEFVTLQDADDWSHPLRIETQVRHLQQHEALVGVTVAQGRATSDLEFIKWAGSGGSVKIVKENVSSMMFRREPVIERVGGWDQVRFGADSELRSRLRHAFGKDAIATLPHALLAFQRVSSNSAIADSDFGYEGFFFGARLEYLQGQLWHHRGQATSRFSPEGRETNFPVPVVMRPDRKSVSNHYDVIIASEFRMHGGSTRSNVEEMIAQKRAGLRTGVVQLFRYDFDATQRRHMLPEARAEMDAETCVPIVSGEKVTCDLLILRYPPILQHKLRYLPTIDANKINVIVNQPPMSDYTEDGVVRYDLERAAQHIREYFGKDATWYPIGPLVRDAMVNAHADQLPHIHLAEDNWYNIIDIQGWARNGRRSVGGPKLRIGRHSRDHFAKWPDRREDILAAYPSAKNVEVHILGGAKSAAALIGKIPGNWTVHPFGALHPRDFLAQIDVFIYFAHPDWVESFGRTIIEAMAVGVPVILPPIYEPLFGTSALYSSPQEAVALARALYADPEAYDRQVAHALDYARRHFSYDMHIDRVSRELVSRHG